jgi:putative PIN family toxin of toxin-antitoxin system
MVSSLIGGWSSPIADAVLADRLEVVSSPALLEELSEVVRRPKIRRYIPEKAREELILLLRHRARIVQISGLPDICRDPSDNYLLAMASASSADYLVTRDEDLLSLRRYGQTLIVYPARFLQILSKL